MSQPRDPRPVFLDDQGPFVFGDGSPVRPRPLGLREALVGWAIACALIVVIPLAFAFALNRDSTNDRIADNRKNLYEQCVDDELRDVIIVKQLQAAIARAQASLPPGKKRTDAVQAIRDGIRALEPPREPDCEPPEGTDPDEAAR